MGYFQVEAKPYILPSEQHANDALTNTLCLADWTEFEIPNGAARLIGMTIIYRGKNGQDVAPTDFEIIWAKGNPGGTAPTSLGVVTAAVGVPAAGSPPWFNLIAPPVAFFLPLYLPPIFLYSLTMYALA